MTEERRIAGQNFVFFGGSSGIGRAAALQIAGRGADILVVARDAKAGAVTVQALRQAGAASADFLAADLSSVAGMKAAADGVVAWKPVVHGVIHSAMTALNSRQITSDGFELAFALQYLARAVLNRLLADALAASGDGRIIHVAGAAPESAIPDLDDLQFERTKWTFFKSILGSQALGFLHAEEAARRFDGRPISVIVACMPPTRTKAMLDKRMPWIMRVIGTFGGKPEAAARNIVEALTRISVAEASGAALRKPKAWTPEPIDWDPAQAARLWDITTRLAAERGLRLP